MREERARGRVKNEKRKAGAASLALRLSRSLNTLHQLFSVSLFVLLFDADARYAVNLTSRFELVDFSRGPVVDGDVVEIVPLPSHLGSIALCGFEYSSSLLPSLLLAADALCETPRCRVHARRYSNYTGRAFLFCSRLNLQRRACTGSSAG